jgi:hypothetical protein
MSSTSQSVPTTESVARGTSWLVRPSTWSNLRRCWSRAEIFCQSLPFMRIKKPNFSKKAVLNINGHVRACAEVAGASRASSRSGSINYKVERLGRYFCPFTLTRLVMKQAALEHTMRRSRLASGGAGSTVSWKRARDDEHLCLPAPVGAQHSFAQSQRQMGKRGITRVPR